MSTTPCRGEISEVIARQGEATDMAVVVAQSVFDYESFHLALIRCNFFFAIAIEISMEKTDVITTSTIAAAGAPLKFVQVSRRTPRPNSASPQVVSSVSVDGSGTLATGAVWP